MGNDEKLRRGKLLTRINRILDEYQDTWTVQETDEAIVIRLREPAAAEPAPASLERLTVAELRALAQAEEVDLGDAERKADIIAAIEAARAESAAGSD